MVVVDKDQRIMAVCAGRPTGDETWENAQQRASEILEAARSQLYLEKEAGRRGGFSALTFGISHGGGQKYPRVLAQGKHNQGILDGLLKEVAFARISGFAASKLS